MSNWASMASCESDWTGSQPTLRLNSTGSSVNSLESEAAALTVPHYSDHDSDAAAGESLLLLELRAWCEGGRVKRTPWLSILMWNLTRFCWHVWWCYDLLVWSVVSSMVHTSTLSSASPVCILLVNHTFKRVRKYKDILMGKKRVSVNKSYKKKQPYSLRYYFWKVIYK